MRDAEAIGPNGETICILMGIKPDSDCLQPLSSVAAAMARAGRWTKAVTIARRMRLKLPRVEVLGVIAAALASAGQTEHALQVALETKEDEERLRVLEEMWSPPSGARDVLKPPARGSEEAAKSAFEPSMRLAAKFKIENERDVAFAMIARANAESGGIERALEAEALVTNPKRLAFVRAAIAEAQARAGFRAVSVAMFERARLALQQIGNAEDELLAIARRQAEAGQPDNAFQELQRLGASRGSDRLALDAKWFVDHGRRRSALWSVARAFAGEGRTEEALKIGEQLGSHKHAVELVAGGLARGGRVEAAAKILNDLPEVERERELMMIVRDCEDLGRYEIALRTLRQIPPDTVRAAATARIAVALRERGDSEGARAAAKEALIAARTTHNQHDLVGLLIDVADALPD